jgi:glucosyl-3-phosphoglycerate synthase
VRVVSSAIRVVEPIDDLDGLAAARVGTSVTVCLPARNEEATVGSIVESIVSALMGPSGIVDELIVLDDSSTDRTAEHARSAGAKVVSVADALEDCEAGAGKGNALWAGVRVASGDLIVFCDADLTSFTPHYVSRLIEPLVADERVAFVKGFYDRPQDAAGMGGGRTTELLARPLLSLLFPELATLRQPLSGEFAGRREVLRGVPFVQGYGVEVGLLIDILRAYGSAAMVQTDLGVKRHRHRQLSELAVQATEIAGVILERAGAYRNELRDSTVLFGGVDEMPVRIAERPPLSRLSTKL